jgi:S-adenosylmethionine:tRNA ribosyltransferase-isomerase
MKLSDFKYPLPRNLIAKHPVSPRDRSKLMVLNRNDENISEKHFRDVVDFFKKGDCLVVN